MKETLDKTVAVYVVIFQKGENNDRADVPDLPGCRVVGETLEEVRKWIAEAIDFYIHRRQETGDAAPQASFQMPAHSPPDVSSQ